MAYDISAVAAAMDQKMVQLEHVSNNLANASTSGFKAEHLLVLNTLQEESKPGDNAHRSERPCRRFLTGISQEPTIRWISACRGSVFLWSRPKRGPPIPAKRGFYRQQPKPAGDPGRRSRGRRRGPHHLEKW